MHSSSSFLSDARLWQASLLWHSFDSGPSMVLRRLCFHDRSLMAPQWYLQVAGKECTRQARASLLSLCWASSWHLCLQLQPRYLAEVHCRANCARKFVYIFHKTKMGNSRFLFFVMHSCSMHCIFKY